MSNILITGHLGFIGSHLKTLIPESIGLDLKDGEDIRKELSGNYDYIFHLAARKSVPIGEIESYDFITTNCWGTVNLMKSFPNARIINVSSSSANDIKSIYGATKLFGEKMMFMHKNWLNVRLYNVFGEGHTQNSIVERLIHSRLTGEPPTIFGDGEQKRDMTYVGDVVQELKRLMFKSQLTGLENLGYSDPISVNELAKFICPNLKPIYKPKRSFDIEYSCAPFSMKAIYGRMEGLKRTISYYETSKA